MIALFYNTISLSGETLKEAIKDCKTQEERILKLMNGRAAMTPFEVLDLYNSILPPVPITSIRRALTNLEKDGKVVKTVFTKKERYGKVNYKWMMK